MGGLCFVPSVVCVCVCVCVCFAFISIHVFLSVHTGSNQILEVVKGLQPSCDQLVCVYPQFTGNYSPSLSKQLLTVVHSPIQTMGVLLLPREQLSTKWPLTAVTVGTVQLEMRHVSAKQMESGLGVNLPVVTV